MYPIVLVENNDDPSSNSMNFRITLNSFLYETGSATYELEPIMYTSVSSFTGLYEEIGTITINLTTNLGRAV